MNNRFVKVYWLLNVAGLGLLLLSGANAANPNKVDVCHAPPGNPDNIQHIQIGANGDSLASHLSHGDWLVTEETCDAIADNNCDGAPDLRADDADCVVRLGVGASCVAGICVPPSPTTPIGTITASIFRGGLPPGSDRGVESAASNLVADAQLWATASNGAEIAFMNPGGVRADFLYPESSSEGDGVVTFGEAFTVQPFGNTLYTFPMTGSQIHSVLEEQCQPAGASRPVLFLGVSAGFTYDLSTTIVAGVCTSVAVTNMMLNGVPLDPAATYLVTTNNFIADGGDNFLTFASIDPSTRLDGGNDLAALLNYLGTFSPVSPPSTDRVNEI